MYVIQEPKVILGDTPTGYIQSSEVVRSVVTVFLIPQLKAKSYTYTAGCSRKSPPPMCICTCTWYQPGVLFAWKP